MADVSELLTRFVDGANNVAEFVVVERPQDVDGDQAVDNALARWASIYSHTLRERNNRNPIHPITAREAQDWFSLRFLEDIVFSTTDDDQERANQLARELAIALSDATFHTTDFVISDWTFSDVVVASQSDRVWVIACLGED